MKPECELGLWSLHREEHRQKPKGNLFQYSNPVIQFHQKVKFQSVFTVSLFLSLSMEASRKLQVRIPLTLQSHQLFLLLSWLVI